jgi:hypothetical protein
MKKFFILVSLCIIAYNLYAERRHKDIGLQGGWIGIWNSYTRPVNAQWGSRGKFFLYPLFSVDGTSNHGENVGTMIDLLDSMGYWEIKYRGSGFSFAKNGFSIEFKGGDLYINPDKQKAVWFDPLGGWLCFNAFLMTK